MKKKKKENTIKKTDGENEKRKSKIKKRRISKNRLEKREEEEK